MSSAWVGGTPQMLVKRMQALGCSRGGKSGEALLKSRGPILVLCRARFCSAQCLGLLRLACFSVALHGLPDSPPVLLQFFRGVNPLTGAESLLICAGGSGDSAPLCRPFAPNSAERLNACLSPVDLTSSGC